MIGGEDRTQRRYTLDEITDAMGRALKSPRVKKQKTPERMVDVYTDVLIEELKKNG